MISDRFCIREILILSTLTLILRWIKSNFNLRVMSTMKREGDLLISRKDSDSKNKEMVITIKKGKFISEMLIKDTKLIMREDLFLIEV